jgi:hypothetical protein
MEALRVSSGLQWLTSLAIVLTFSVMQVHSSQVDNNIQAQQPATPDPTPFPVCIDDSDCVKLGEGNKFACFQYICYPWKNDSYIDPKNRRKTCRRDEDCDPGQECYRHHDKRMINRGLCFDEVKSCQASNECSKNYQCCGGACCEEKYYQQFSTLPCNSDFGCQDLGLGRFCCPRKNQSNQCCDVNPNPSTTPYPKSQAIGAASTKSVSFMVTATLFLVALSLVY